MGSSVFYTFLLLIAYLSPLSGHSTTKSSSTDTHFVPVYYLSLPPGSDDYNVRYENLQKIRSSDPAIRSLIGFSGKKQWDLITDGMCVFKLPIKAMTVQRKGKAVPAPNSKYAEFLSIFMAVSYAYEFELPYVALMEDDTTWGTPNSYRSQLTELAKYAKLTEQNNPKAAVVANLNDSGKGFFFTRRGMLEFLEKVFTVGINNPIDSFIKRELNAIPWKMSQYKRLTNATHSSAHDNNIPRDLKTGTFKYKPHKDASKLLPLLNSRSGLMLNSTVGRINGTHTLHSNVAALLSGTYNSDAVSQAAARTRLFPSFRNTNFSKVLSYHILTSTLTGEFKRSECYKPEYIAKSDADLTAVFPDYLPSRKGLPTAMVVNRTASS